MELVVFGTEIHHQVVIHVSQTCHGSGAEHVADELLRGAGLESRGTSQYLRTNFNFDGKLGVTSEIRATIANDGNCGCPFFASKLQGGDGVWSAATGGESHNDVVLARFLCGHIAATESGIIFIGFGSP